MDEVSTTILPLGGVVTSSDAGAVAMMRDVSLGDNLQSRSPTSTYRYHQDHDGHNHPGESTEESWEASSPPLGEGEEGDVQMIHHRSTRASGAASSRTNNRGGPVLYRSVSNIDVPQVRTGIWGASSNLVNAIVGAGIIGIPYAIGQTGLVLGIVLLILVSYLTDKTLRMIIELAAFHPDLRNKGVLTFEDLMSIPFGIWGTRFVLSSMLILAYGAMVAYLLIIKDTLPTVLGLGNSFVEREGVMFISSALIVLPLSMMRDISQLAWTSTLSVLADILLVVIVVYFSPVASNVAAEGGWGQVWAPSNWVHRRLFIGLGVLSTAMACQHSAFLIAGSLARPTAARWRKVTGSSLTLAGSLSLLLGVTGYLGFGSATQGDILNNFAPDSVAVNAGRALLAITMFLTYPMESLVARHVLMQLLFDGRMDPDHPHDNGHHEEGGSGHEERATLYRGCFGYCDGGRRVRWTLYLYIMTLIPALLVDDLGPVLSLTGSLGASCIAYIAPGLAYLGLNGADFLAWVQGPPRRGTTITSAETAAAELPVEGDATARLSSASSWQGPPSQSPPHSRPCWWWPLAMPLWVALATRGARGTQEFWTRFHALPEGERSQHPTVDLQGEEQPEVIGPRRRDYVMSIFLISFGTLAAVAGVTSNIYVEVHNIFYSPQ